MNWNKLIKYAAGCGEVLRSDGSYTIRWTFDIIDRSERPYQLVREGLILFTNIDNFKKKKGVSHGYCFRGKEVNEPLLTYQELKEIIEQCNHYQAVLTLEHDHTR